MFEYRKRRIAAAVGGVLLLAGAGTTGAAMASEFRAVLSNNDLLSGDSDGWGRAKVDIDGTLNRLCADLEVRSVAEVTSAQIHRGGAGAEGPAVVNLDAPDGEDQDEDDCDQIGDSLAEEIQSNPAAFYVMIKTTDHPGGALRGQLAASAD